jgi:hypothetical protein
VQPYALMHLGSSKHKTVALQLLQLTQATASMGILTKVWRALRLLWVQPPTDKTLVQLAQSLHGASLLCC